MLAMADTRSAAQIEAAACGTKVRFGRRGAMESAARIRATGDQMSAYRCPFCRWWHVGHAPSMDTIARLALIIRGLD